MAGKEISVRRRDPAGHPARRQQARRRRPGDPRPPRPQRRPRQEVRLPDDHQGWCLRRQGDRALRPQENMGAQMVREVASKTSDVAGDGTTTATVLARAIYREGVKHVTAGHNPMDLKRGIDLAVEKVVAHIEKQATDVKGSDIAKVGTVSANNDKRRSARSSPRRWTRSARTASSRSRRPRASRRPSTWSRACSSTAATSRRTS